MAPDPSVVVCPTCGANYPPSVSPPTECEICADERQWVPPGGQVWRTMGELAGSGYETEVREIERDLHGIGVEPHIGVGHRGLLVATSEGNLLWDPPPFLDEGAIDAVRGLGGVRALASSHPHMYGAIVEWSHAFDAEILLPEADAGWLKRPDPAVRQWSGAVEALPGVTVVQCGGHFPGSAILHWAEGADGDGVILCGDTLFVTPGEDRVSFLWSAPNRLPLPEREVRGVLAALEPYRFECIYGGWWTPVLRRGARAILAQSGERYIEFLRGDALDGAA